MADFLGVSVRKGGTPLPTARLSVERFGPVIKANLELARFLILVGRNNTGKSYIANLLWAFRNFRTAVVGRDSQEAPTAPEWFREWAEQDHASTGYAPIELTGERIEAALNEWFANNEAQIARRILSYEGTPIAGLRIRLRGSIWLRKRSKPSPAFTELGDDLEISSWEISRDRPKGKHDNLRNEDYSSQYIGSTPRDLISELFLEVAEKFVLGELGASRSNATYLPAARSGLMLSLPFLYSSLLENVTLSTEDRSLGQLPLATVRFLQSLTARHRSNPRKSHSKIADFLERDIINGTISRDGGNQAAFSYAPSGSAVTLPLHVTSSLIGEIAPFLFLLRNDHLGDGIVLEEPEAHLHLSAQRSMARAVARLLNDGVPVAITTHSDTFIQQINVLGRLRTHPDRENLLEKYGYSSDETIDLEGAHCYEFRRSGTSTRISRIKPSALGFAVPSLNETLIELAEEAVETNMGE